MLEGLIGHIEGLIAKLDDPTHLENIADDFAARLRVNVPRSSGRMAITLTEVSIPEKSAEGWIIGVGNPELVGFDDEQPPPHTISEFLKAFPRFRQPSLFSGTPSKAIGKRAGRPVARVFLTSSTAWWLLSEKAKETLAWERRGGRFGGENASGVGRTPYVYAQEGSRLAWGDSAARAGISPKFFIQKSLDDYAAMMASRIAAVMAE